MTTLAGTEIGGQLLQATDETLEGIFGKRARVQVYDYLERELMLKRNEIPARPEVFSKGISALFGSASKMIELAILKKFYNRLGVTFEPRENFNFADYIAGIDMG